MSPLGLAPSAASLRHASHAARSGSRSNLKERKTCDMCMHMYMCMYYYMQLTRRENPAPRSFVSCFWILHTFALQNPVRVRFILMKRVKYRSKVVP